MITPPCKEGRECETIGRFAVFLIGDWSFLQWEKSRGKKTVKAEVGNEMPFIFAK